jgi:hypothetical protein
MCYAGQLESKRNGVVSSCRENLNEPSQSKVRYSSSKTFAINCISDILHWLGMLRFSVIVTNFAFMFSQMYWGFPIKVTDHIS